MEDAQSVVITRTHLMKRIQSIINELTTQKGNDKIKQGSITRYAKHIIHIMNNNEEKYLNQK